MSFQTPLLTRRAAAVTVAIGFTLALAGARADDSSEAMTHAAGAGSKVIRTTVQYTIPQVRLVRDDGKSVSLPDEMNDGRPVVLNFVFTTCGSICPLMSQIFGQFQQRMAKQGGDVHLMSISTDPEQDTPERLREYAKQFGAGPSWQHYTGTLQASQAAQRAFDVYRGDKMSHTAVTLIRIAPGQPWRRIDGFVTPDELVHEFHQLLAAR
jgi:protein SCO1/2